MKDLDKKTHKEIHSAYSKERSLKKSKTRDSEIPEGPNKDLKVFHSDLLRLFQRFH